MEEPLEILVVEPESKNRQAAKDGCPDGVLLIFVGSYEEAMREVNKGGYDRGIFEQEIPRDGETNGWGYLPMMQAMNKGLPSLLYTEKRARGKARAYIDPIFYLISHNRFQLETAGKSDKVSWSQVFDYLINNKEASEMVR